MKPKTLKTILLAAALAPAALFADTATTTPVGYVTITTPASSDATVTLPLQRPALLKTAVSSVAGNVVTFASAGISADAFVNSPATYTKSYLLVTSGPLAGERFPVTANTATTVTVDAGTTLETAGLLAGATFSVIPNWTLGTAFPAGAGVGASQDIYDPKGLLLVSDQSSVGLNRGSAAAYFYNDGTDGNPVGWRDAADPEGSVVDDLALDPTITYTVRSSESPQSAVIAGEVPSSKLVSYIDTSASSDNDSYVSNPFPIDITLSQSGLQAAIAPTSDIYDPKAIVLLYDEDATGLNKGASSSFFYHDGSDGNDAGWRDAADPEGALVTGAVLKAGRGFTVRSTASQADASVKWSASLPYSL